MKVSEITNSVSTLPGVGHAKAALFASLNVFTVGDLLQFYPRGYEDRTEKVTIGRSSAAGGAKVHTIAQVVAHEWFGFGRMRTLKLVIADGTGEAELIAFNRPFLEKAFPVGSILAVTGKFAAKYGAYQATAFEAEKMADAGNIGDFADADVPNSRVIPIYRLTEGLTSKVISKIVSAALERYSVGLESDLDESILARKGLVSKKDALKKSTFRRRFRRRPRREKCSCTRSCSSFRPRLPVAFF